MEMNLDVSMCEWNEPLMRYCVMNFGSNLNKTAPAIINDRKFEWVKWSFPLLKIIKSGNDDMLNMNRRRWNQDLKGALQKSGLKFGSEDSQVKRDLRTITDLVKTNKDKARDKYSHAYETTTHEVLQETAVNEAHDI